MGGSMKEPKVIPEILTAVEAFKAARDILIMQLFQKIIKPVTDRYDWEIEWGMGGVYFTNKKGEDVSDCRTVEKLTGVVSEYTYIIHGNDLDPLWNVMGELPVNASFYHKSYGFQESARNLIRK
jgi:aminopeptidase-like protein